MRQCECGNQVANNAKACPKCGHRFTGGIVKFLAWFFGILMGLGILVAIIGESNSTSTLAPNNVRDSTAVATGTAPSVAAKSGHMTDAERNYFGAAGSYLKTGNEEGMVVARSMAGASNGSSTLGDIRTAISSAKRIENAG